MKPITKALHTRRVVMSIATYILAAQPKSRRWSADRMYTEVLRILGNSPSDMDGELIAACDEAIRDFLGID